VAVPQRAVAGALARTLSRADDRKRIRGMREFEVTFPTLLMQLHQLEFDYDDGEGIDFEAYHEFQAAKDTADWIKAWTGNHELTAAEYRIFGQDGSGGYAAFWLVRERNRSSSSPSSSLDPRARRASSDGGAQRVP
jgi:hypothetical protein